MMRWYLFFLLSIAVGVDRLVADNPPNVILFLVDDMGWMDSTPYGSQYYDTPSMERLAQQGMRFTQAYSQPLCSPTRASILTGLYPSRHGVTTAGGHTAPQEQQLPETGPPNRPLLMPESKTFLDPKYYTLAEALRDAGYRTGHFGKWHLGLTQPHWPEQHGFDVAFHCEPSAGPPGAYFSPYGVLPPDAERPKQRGARYVAGTITDGPPGEYITDRLTDEALEFIEENKARPFFLNLWHYGVHGPWGHKEGLAAEMAQRKDPTGRQDNPVMASMLKSVDESLGRVLDKLDQLQLAGNTIVIFTSDNGGNIHSMTEEESKSKNRPADNPTTVSYRKWAAFKPPTNNAPLRDGKGRLYEGGIRVPLIVRWPEQVQAGATSDAVVGCIDIYPTVMDLIAQKKAPTLPKWDGVSYAPVLRGTGQLTREAYFTWFPHLVPGVAVRQGDWKLIRRFEERPDQYEGTRELFNLKDDLGETTNLAAQMPEKVQQLDALIEAFIEETGALSPRPNPAYQPRPASKASADPAAGLVFQRCEGDVLEGRLRITADKSGAYIGTAQVKHEGPLALQLRVRSESGGPGRVQWSTREQTEFPATGQSVDFQIPAGETWRDITVEAPIDGHSRIIRLYVPADRSPVEIQSIQWLTSPGGQLIRDWKFGPRSP